MRVPISTIPRALRQQRQLRTRRSASASRHDIVALRGVPGREVVETFTEWDTFRTRMAQFMEAYDAIVCPTTATVAPPWRTQDRHRFAYTVPFSLTGYPSAVVRGGQGPDGRPIGVQVAGRLWREDVTLALATVLEQSLGGWQPPKEI